MARQPISRKFRRSLRFAPLEDRTLPATYLVNSLLDTGAGSALTGDLRYCINQANANPGADLIDASGVTGTILLNNELPTITEDVFIFGPGAKSLDIDGNLGVRLFQVSGSGSTKVEFNDLKFTNGGTLGNGGVAIISNAQVSFTDCVLNNSFANVGGLLFGMSTSSITINRCTMSGSNGTAGGGAVYSQGILNIRNTTLSGNNTGPFGSGGAILVGGSSFTTIVNSTVSGNTAAAHGGGVRTTSVFTGTLHLKTSTVTQNVVLPGSGTGRGISQGGGSGSIKIDGTIVSQNSGGSASTSDVNGVITANYSLFGTTDAAMITGNGNFKGTNASPVDAKLGPLANNGGPTLTHLPADDSPVREAGFDQELQSEDQRGLGYARLEGYFTDIGAVETEYYQPMALNIEHVVDEASPATTYQFTVTYFDPRGSLLIDYSSLGTGDIYVADQKSYLEYPTFISAEPGEDAQTIVATYEMPVPVNGKAGWDISDNGYYGVLMAPGEIFDKDTPTPLSGTVVYFTFIKVQIPVVYVVDEVSDVVDMKYGSGELSLREAILLANSDNQFSRIEFDAGVFASDTTITLNGNELAIDQPLTLVGPAAPLTLDGDAKSRIFNTSGAALNASIEISNLTITNGKQSGPGILYGGGIFIGDENVTLDHVTVSNCQGQIRGGGVFVYSEGRYNVVTIRDCLITGNSATNFGGGLHFAYSGEVNLIRCTISNNFAASTGGGFDCYGMRNVTVVDSAITGNQTGVGDSGPRGGGIYFRSFIFSPASSMSITNCTISSNVAKYLPTGEGVGGGISYQNGTTGGLTITNSTITGNTTGVGGGLRIVYGYVDLQSSIIAGNTSGDGREIYGMQYVGRGPITITGTNNIIGVGDTGKMMIQPGNLTGTKASPLDPMLAPLADNGGPTQTHALLPGSPAINAGNNVAGLTNDQRGDGFVRVAGGVADIGAFEVQQVAVSSVVVNGGDKQRSRVTTIEVTFDADIILPPNPADAFQLLHQGDNAVVDLDAVVSGNTVTLTFIGGAVDGAVGDYSLIDGRYTLTVFASAVNSGGLDGDGDNSPGDDYVLIGDPAMEPKLFRLFGDSDGNNIIDLVDFGAFRAAFNPNYNSIFDFDGLGTVDLGDFSQFRTRFGMGV